MITLHLYRKNIIHDNYYVDRRPMGVFVDGYHICDMKPSDYTAVYVTPGAHKIVVKVPVLISNTLTKEFTADANTTDVYVAFAGRMGKYISPKIFEPAQYNMAEFSSMPGNTTKVTFRCEDIALKHFIWYTVNIDDRAVGIMDGKNPELVLNVPRGKHRITFESLFDVGYSWLDVRDDDLYVVVNDCKAVCVLTPPAKPANPGRQVKCVFTRPSQFSGCAGSTKVTLDTNIYFKLKNGESKTMYISEGIHSLVLKANRINVQQFIVPANCSEIDILLENLEDIKSITAKA